MSIWLGGLATLALIVLDRDPDAGRSAQRFSPVALTSVVIIVVTGVFASWRQVGFSRDAFLDTAFGRLLLIKVAMFIALVALAAWSRRIVRGARRRSARWQSPTKRRRAPHQLIRTSAGSACRWAAS